MQRGPDARGLFVARARRRSAGGRRLTPSPARPYTPATTAMRAIETASTPQPSGLGPAVSPRRPARRAVRAGRQPPAPRRGPRMTGSPTALEDATQQAETLAKALPFLRRYAGATIVVKYGGHAMGEDALAEQFAADIALPKQGG